MEVDRSIRLVKDERAGHEKLGRHTRILGVEKCSFSDSHITGGAGEAAVLGDRHGMLVHPEAADLRSVDRALLGIKIIGAHEEGAPGHPHHVLEQFVLSHPAAFSPLGRMSPIRRLTVSALENTYGEIKDLIAFPIRKRP
jgi:hypothetical protein